MNELTTWNYENTEIRTIEKDGETWWALVDICNVLELTNSRMVAERLDEDERRKFNLPRQGETWFMSESGLYSVILRSDKPQAKPFRRWVTHEVLPEIRKTGSYNSSTLNIDVDNYIYHTCKALGIHTPVPSSDLICLADKPNDYYTLKIWDALRSIYGYAPHKDDIVIDNATQLKTVLYLKFHIGRFHNSHCFEAKFQKRGTKWKLSNFTHHALTKTGTYYIDKNRNQ